MKKTRVQIRLWCHVLMAFVFCAVLSGSAYAGQVIGKITQLKGDVTVFPEDSKQGKKAANGMDLQENDRIKTQAKAYVRFQLNDGSIMTLGEKGDMKLDQFQFKPEEKKRVAFVSVVVGKLRIFANEMLKYRDNRFNVKTPTAVAGVRGTLFVVWVDSAQVTHVLCLDRSVEVFHHKFPKLPVILTKNIFTVVPGDKPPTPPALITTDQFNEFQKGFMEDIRLKNEEKGKDSSQKDSERKEDKGGKSPLTAPVVPGSGIVLKPEFGKIPSSLPLSTPTTTTTTTTTSSTTTTTSSTSTTTTTLPSALPQPPGVPH